MSIRKKVMLIIAVIAIISLFILETEYFQLLNIKKTYEGPKITKTSLLPGMEMDNIFFGQSFDYIAMYGDPKNWDDEKNMCLDTNGDELNDICFTISPSRKDGIDLEGKIKQSNGSWKSMNFWSSDLYKLFRNFLQEKAQVQRITAKDFLTLDISSLLSLLQEGKFIVKGGSIVDDDYVQISICDIDEDGVEEVLASIGNQLDENVTAIYEFSFVSKTPFKYCGYIRCDTVVEYKGDNILWAYRGSLKDKQHDIYIYNGKTIKKLVEVDD